MKFINCKKCRKYLGEIRDATLRKGIVYMCEQCSRPEPQWKEPQRQEDDVLKFMKGFME
jgi:hypothetical protein